ncbi:putative ATP-dependent DNA helicase RecQ [Nymphon striatum]|nr:putative ATP-dependent DNA helicase RecQ [Nymphon striatum]
MSTSASLASESSPQPVVHSPGAVHERPEIAELVAGQLSRRPGDTDRSLASTTTGSNAPGNDAVARAATASRSSSSLPGTSAVCRSSESKWNRTSCVVSVIVSWPLTAVSLELALVEPSLALQPVSASRAQVSSVGPSSVSRSVSPSALARPSVSPTVSASSLVLAAIAWRHSVPPSMATSWLPAGQTPSTGSTRRTAAHRVRRAAAQGTLRRTTPQAFHPGTPGRSASASCRRATTSLTESSELTPPNTSVNASAIATDHLHSLTGNPAATFRDGQLEAIVALAQERSRVLVIQRTGWGKSAVYFIATKMLREQGAGPTLVISPLLALMRNQLAAAERLGIRAETINSTNQKAWAEVEARIHDDTVDLLLVSPERFANVRFRETVLPLLGRRAGLIVVDEVHCISDWGHDFRPNYRRIRNVLDLLPSDTPVCGCTATANERVQVDVADQLGENITVIRGSMLRPGMQLGGEEVPSLPARLAWLAEAVKGIPGSGIVYCLTISDTEMVASWLRSQGLNAAAYSGQTPDPERIAHEQALLNNELDVLVATSALGMGFDKPDLGFVIHFQTPSSPVAYYQQVGRAGRQLETSIGMLLHGSEDTAIQNWFIEHAFPTEDEAGQIIDVLDSADEALRENDILEQVNVKPSRLKLFLNIAEVDGHIAKTDNNRWLRTLTPYTYDVEQVEAVTAMRRAEQQAMQDYLNTTDCRAISPGPALVAEAGRFIRANGDDVLAPRKQYPDRKGIPAELRHETGRILSRWNDGGWGNAVSQAKRDRNFPDDLIDASLDVLSRWQPDVQPTWVTVVPSALLGDFAR